MMGEQVENVGGGIDTYSIRQPLGVTAGVCPFNFPGTHATVAPMCTAPARKQGLARARSPCDALRALTPPPQP